MVVMVSGGGVNGCDGEWRGVNGCDVVEGVGSCDVVEG